MSRVTLGVGCRPQRQSKRLKCASRDCCIAERSVDLARKWGDDVILSRGLEAGDRVLLSNLDGAASGMQVRTIEEDE